MSELGGAVGDGVLEKIGLGERWLASATCTGLLVDVGVTAELVARAESGEPEFHSETPMTATIATLARATAVARFMVVSVILRVHGKPRR